MRSPAEIDSFFDKIVGSKNNYKNDQDMVRYEKGYRYGAGKALRILRPQTTDQVSKILLYCNENKISIVPQGGNTGLVGGSVPDSSGLQILLSTELLNKNIFDLDKRNKTLYVGCAWVLDAINQKLENDNLFLPIDIGSSGSCNIGGVISTNAAGTRAGRYGSAKYRVAEFTVVLANGKIMQGVKVNLPSSKKNVMQDNSRLDLDNIFIGSQGWLGIITDAVVKLEDKSLQDACAVLVPSSPENIAKIRKIFSENFGDEFTAFEGISENALRLVAKNIPNTDYLFAGDKEKKPEHDYTLLVEVSSSDKNKNLQEKLEVCVLSLYEKKLIVTGRIDRPEIFWHQRHHLSEALSKEGSIIATDIAMPDPDSLTVFRLAISPLILKKWPHLIIAPFGHEMLGAAHFNLVWPKTFARKITPEEKEEIQDFIYDKVIHEFKGVFSAEHGVGPHNQKAYQKYIPQSEKIAAAKLKQQYDPNGILNPNLHYEPQ